MWLTNNYVQVFEFWFKKICKLSFLFLILILTGCRNPPPEYLANEINLAPILDRNIPYEVQDIAKIIDMEALGNLQEVSFPFPETTKKSDLRFLFTTHDQFDKPINLSITMQLYSDAEQAQTSHLLKCDTSSYSARIYDAGKGELFNSPFKYCTKELKLAQANDTVFPAYYGYYTTSRIQKGNLVIVISENGQSFDVLDRSPVNEAIEKIAKTIKEQT